MLLRKLNFHGEMLDSHVLHVYMLVAPDMLGVGSVIPLVQIAPEAVLRALRLKKLAGDLCAVISGRHTHPIAMAVGGFTHFPTIAELKALRGRLVDARADMDETVKLAKTLPWPQFNRETEYVALRKEDEYAFIDGTITTTDGGSYAIKDYRQVTNERMVTHATAKHCAHKRESYMVGALARFNVNHDKLHPRAKAAAEELGLKPICTNPYLNTAAQVVEMVHCVEDAINIIDELVDRGVKPEPLPAFPGKGGEGAGSCEVPRGILFHNYQIGDDGNVIGANCIIPTGQNLANIDADMRTLVPQILDRPQDEIRQMMEMLVPHVRSVHLVLGAFSGCEVCLTKDERRKTKDEGRKRTLVLRLSSFAPSSFSASVTRCRPMTAWAAAWLRCWQSASCRPASRSWMRERPASG